MKLFPKSRRKRLREEILATEFTSHNIDLGDGVSTMGGSRQPLMPDLTITAAIKDFFSLTGLGKRRERSRLLDLGCLEGGFSLEFANYGFKQVVGVEGHRSNFEKCAKIADYFQPGNLAFLHKDVKQLNPDEHGAFDVILCLGLLYHLDSPVEFIHLMSEMLNPNGLLFLDTHYAPRDEHELDDFKYTETYLGRKIVEKTFRDKVYQGRWWREYDEGTPESEHHAWNAVSNWRSFVLTYHSLTSALLDAGFTHTYRLPFGDIPWEAASGYKMYRTWLACFRKELLEDIDSSASDEGEA